MTERADSDETVELDGAIADEGTPDQPTAAEAAPDGTAERPVTTREIERKLRVPALFRRPDVTTAEGIGSVEVHETFTQTATYYDTDDLRLARWGVTLRRRTGGTDDGWHLKLPVPGAPSGDRDEVTLPLDASPDATVPAALADIVTALVRHAPLTAVATLRTERTPLVLRDEHGTEVAELVDDVVSVLDGDVVAGRFREIEVESRTGDDRALGPVVDLLVAAGAEPGVTSKAVHALGPRATAPPDVPAPGSPGPRSPAREAVQAHLLLHTRRFLVQDMRVRRGLPDAVHQMRVAARRLRSGLRTFRPLLDREWADALRGELAWAAGELGAVRDTEVLLDRLDRHAGLLEEPLLAERVRAVVDPALRARLEAATAEALEAMRTERHLALLDALVAAAREPAFTAAADDDCRDVLPPLAQAAWRRLVRTVEVLELEGESTEWHAARIAAKRARYALESLEPVFGRSAERFAEALEEVTEQLGEHQDAHVARLTLRELADTPGHDGLEGFALGMLHGLEDAAEMAARRRFVRLWPRVRRVHRKTRLR